MKKSRNVQPFRPTWLYIKTHNVTGKKYVGKTCEKDPVKYRGSGTYWNLHLKKYGNDVSTEIIGYYTNKELCNWVALQLSRMYRLGIEIDTFLNLTFEDGLGGRRRSLTQQEKQRLREIQLARVRDGTNPFAGQQGSKMSKENAQKRIDNKTHHFLGPKTNRETIWITNGICNKRINSVNIQDYVIQGWFRGRVGQFNKPTKECQVCHKMVSPGNYAKSHGDKCEQPLSPCPNKECPHCHRMIGINVYNQWHGDKCKQNYSS